MRKADDFSGVDPARLAEVKRRISVLREYLEIEKPRGADAKAAAQRMGVGISLFYTLVRVWKRTRRPADLPGAQVGGARRTGSAQLDPAAEKVLTDAIAANRGRSLRQITRAIRTAFSVADLEPPAGVTIALRAQRALGDSGYWPKFADGAVIVILAFQVDAAVAVADGETLPWVIMARHARSRRLLAWGLSLSRTCEDACRNVLVEALRSLTTDERSEIGTTGPPTIVTAHPTGIERTEVGRVIVYSGWTLVVADDQSINLARGLFGTRVAELRLRTWRPGAPAAAWKTTPRLDLDDLRERLQLALGDGGPASAVQAFDLASYLAARLADAS